ncbi:MAG: hypothetical protein U1G05_14210 [Kiritimatiellia bacterium]
MVMAGAVVNPGSSVGCGCILLNTRSSLITTPSWRTLPVGSRRHHRGASGSVMPAIGLGALLREAVVIGGATVVGAGALVLSDLPSGVLALGAPARVIRARQPGETYLR